MPLTSLLTRLQRQFAFVCLVTSPASSLLLFSSIKISHIINTGISFPRCISQETYKALVTSQDSLYLNSSHVTWNMTHPCTIESEPIKQSVLCMTKVKSASSNSFKTNEETTCTNWLIWKPVRFLRDALCPDEEAPLLALVIIAGTLKTWRTSLRMQEQKRMERREQLYRWVKAKEDGSLSSCLVKHISCSKSWSLQCFIWASRATGGTCGVRASRRRRWWVDVSWTWGPSLAVGCSPPRAAPPAGLR